MTMTNKRMKADPASLDALGNDEKAVLSFINGNFGPTTLTVGGEEAQAQLSGRSARALLALISRGLVSATIFNNTGRVEYRPTELAAPLRGKVSEAFIKKHARFPLTEPTTPVGPGNSPASDQSSTEDKTMSTDKTVSVEQLFPNVDAWGAAEWFERLVTAIQRQDECVLKKDDAGFEISRMIAASSAMRIARDYAEEIRAALAAPQPAASDVPHDVVRALEEVRAAAEQEPRTYSWNGQTHTIQSPQLSDIEVACKVRMLMRDQLDHESVCTLARDRIVHLSERLAAVRSALATPAPSTSTGAETEPVAWQVLDFEGVVMATYGNRQSAQEHVDLYSARRILRPLYAAPPPSTEECAYCANTGWFYGDADLKTFCGCAFGKVRGDATPGTSTEEALRAENARLRGSLSLVEDEISIAADAISIDGGFTGPAASHAIERLRSAVSSIQTALSETR